VGIDQILEFGHKILNLTLRAHTAHAVILIGDNAQKLSVRSAILRNRNGGMACPLRQAQDIRQRHFRRYIGVTHHKTGTIAFYLFHHFRLLFNGLGAIDKRQAALLCQGDRKPVIGNRLHNSRYHGNVNGQRRFFTPSVLNKRRFQTHFRRDTLCRRIPRDQKIFTERSGWFLIIKCHVTSPFPMLTLASGYIRALIQVSRISTVFSIPSLLLLIEKS
jgi:hypothetical protein